MYEDSKSSNKGIPLVITFRNAKKILFVGNKLTKIALEACEDLCINPIDLLAKSITEFSKGKTSDSVIKLTQLHYEKKRKSKILLLANYIRRGNVKATANNQYKNKSFLETNSNTMDDELSTSKIYMKTQQNKERQISAYKKALDSLISKRAELRNKLRDKDLRLEKRRKAPTKEQIIFVLLIRMR